MSRRTNSPARGVLAAALAVVMAAGSISLFVSAQPVQDLADEILNAENGAVIAMRNDWAGTVAVGGNQKVTIDLNGFQLSAPGNTVISNNGELTLLDSKGTGSVKISGSQDVTGVMNRGKLTLESGRIDAAASGDGIAHGVSNQGTMTMTGGSVSAMTTGSKWAIGVYNTGTIEDISGGDIRGEIKNSSNPNNALGISTESGAVVKSLSGGTISAKVNNDGVAYGIRNRGKIEEIRGGAVNAVTTGSKWAFALYNVDTGVIDQISGGALSGEIDNPGSPNNALGISNEGTISAISGGSFLAKINGKGSAYGLRNDKTVAAVSGGAYKGNTAGNAVYNRSGTISYANGYSLSAASSGPGLRYVLPTGGYYVQLCDERENWVGTYTYQKGGELLKILGDGARDSYTVYNWDRASENKTVECTADELGDMKKNTTLTVKLDEQDRPILYFLGSSVTYGEAAGGVSFVEDMAKDNDWICHKRAVSGTTLVDNGSGSYVQRMKAQISENAYMDHFICQLSTNDASQNKPLGKVSGSRELKDFNTSTIVGAMEYIIAYAKQTWNCPVTFYTNPKYNSAAYVKMIDALYELQEKWDIGVIDFYNYADMDELPAATLRSYMHDDIHPNAKGYQWMADVMSEYFKGKPGNPDDPGGDTSSGPDSSKPASSDPAGSKPESKLESSKPAAGSGQTSDKTESGKDESSSKAESAGPAQVSSDPESGADSDSSAGGDGATGGAVSGTGSPQTGAVSMQGFGLAMLCAVAAGAMLLFKKRVNE